MREALVVTSGFHSSALHQEPSPAVTADQGVFTVPLIWIRSGCLQPPSGLRVSVIAVWGREAARLVMVHQRPEGVEEHQRQRSVTLVSLSSHLPAPRSVPGPPPPSLSLYPRHSLPRPPPAFCPFTLGYTPMTALPPPLTLSAPPSLARLLCPDPLCIARHPTSHIPFSLTFKGFDNLEFVGEVGPS